MTTSVFTSGLNQCHEVPRLADDPGPAGQAVLIMGDNTKGGGPDARRSTYHIWDLAEPEPENQPIPKNAIVDEAYIKFVAQQNFADLDDDNHTHAVALMASDGHWDRSSQNALHQANGAAYYYAPSQTNVLWVRARNSADSEIADTMVDTSGATNLSSSQARFQALGSTIEIPAGEDIKTIRVNMTRDQAPLPADPTLTMKVYTLYENGRQFALDTLIASSEPVAYSALSLTPTFSDIDFTFATAIPSQAASRWVGVLIEGEIFDSLYLGTQIYQLKTRSVTSQSVYPSDTAGSMLHADPDTDIANANSLVGYLNSRSVPCLYQVSSSVPLTTPYQRFFGSAMVKTQCGPWVQFEPKTYGSAVADEEFPDFVQNIRDWIDSDYFSPWLGKTWIGCFVDIPWSENVQIRTIGPGHATYASYKLVIEWHPRPSVRASGRALQRVAAGQSRAVERVVSDATAGHRVTAASTARPRVRASISYAALRVRAPLSNARSGV